ncbi:MAG: DUF5317 family protein [Eubacteriaceae bacterium]|nr:DUF5317 family protein [Eubacteriaceae bacterium]
MIVIGLLLIAIVIGYIRKGKIMNIAHLRIRLVPLMVLAFLLQGAIYAGYAYDIGIIKEYDILLHFVSYIILFAALMSNFENKWFILLTMGVIMNFIVIFLNGGKMPVSLTAAETIGITDGLQELFLKRGGTHQELTNSTILWYLADIIPVKLPGILSFFNNILSVGDLVIYLGAMGVIQGAMLVDEDYYDELGELEDEDVFAKASPEDEQYRDYFDDSEDLDNRKTANAGQTVTEETIAIGSIIKNLEMTENMMEENEYEEIHTQEADIVVSLAEEINEPDEDIEKTQVIHRDAINSALTNLEGAEEPFAETYMAIEPEAEILQAEFIPDETTPETEVVELPLAEEAEQEEGIPELLQEAEHTEESEVPIPDVPKEFEAAAIEPEVVQLNKPIAAVPVDTVHQFIIIDGRIVENPNYHKKFSELEAAEKASEEEMEVFGPEELEVEIEGAEVLEEDVPQKELEIPFKFTSIADLNENFTEKPKEDGNLLQRISDSERVELMKKMRERKENGYSLEQVTVGDKQISFWKKDL